MEFSVWFDAMDNEFRSLMTAEGRELPKLKEYSDYPHLPYFDYEDYWIKGETPKSTAGAVLRHLDNEV